MAWRQSRSLAPFDRSCPEDIVSVNEEYFPYIVVYELWERDNSFW